MGAARAVGGVRADQRGSRCRAYAGMGASGLVASTSASRPSSTRIVRDCLRPVRAGRTVHSSVTRIRFGMGRSGVGSSSKRFSRPGWIGACVGRTTRRACSAGGIWARCDSGEKPRASVSSRCAKKTAQSLEVTVTSSAGPSPTLTSAARYCSSGPLSVADGSRVRAPMTDLVALAGSSLHCGVGRQYQAFQTVIPALTAEIPAATQEEIVPTSAMPVTLSVSARSCAHQSIQVVA